MYVEENYLNGDKEGLFDYDSGSFSVDNNFYSRSSCTVDSVCSNSHSRGLELSNHNSSSTVKGTISFSSSQQNTILLLLQLNYLIKSIAAFGVYYFVRCKISKMC